MRLAAVVLVPSLAWSAAVADDDGARRLCPLVLHEEERDRDDLALECSLASTRLAAAEEIFGMLQGLWNAESVERMTYLRGKYDRDIAAGGLQRARALLERQEALLDEIRLLCAPAGKEAPPGPSAPAEEAHRRYLRSDCEAREREQEMAGLEVAFQRELLVSVEELERGEVAARGRVILARRDLELAERTLAESTRRAALCRATPAPD